MSRKQLLNKVYKELTAVNNRIDHKIIRGISYSRDAARHKMLLSQISRVSSRNIFSRLMPFF